MTAARSGYTPKPGDRIRLSYEGTVTDLSVNGDWVYIGGERNNPWPLTENGAATRALDAVPVVELVTRPFVVGGPITPEMGEPPLNSVVSHPKGPLCWQRLNRGWCAGGLRPGSRADGSAAPGRWVGDLMTPLIVLFVVGYVWRDARREKAAATEADWADASRFFATLRATK